MNNINSKVISKGGSKYEVTIGDDTQLINLEGTTVMSDEDFEKIEQAGLLLDEMECPKAARFSELYTPHTLAALDYVANHSDFNADNYIEANQK
jgi:hypothetical protein